jgi:AAA-like domain
VLRLEDTGLPNTYGQLDGPFGDHLRTLQVKLRESTKHDLLAALKQVIRHGTAPNDDILARLLGAGLIRAEGDRFVPANTLYARFFGNLQ